MDTVENMLTDTIPNSEKDAYQRLKETGNLPTPSEKARRIYQLANDRLTAIDDLAEVILSDPAISAALVKMANSVYYRSLTAITSVDRAIVRLGFKMVRTISLGLSLIARHRKGACPAFDYEKFWSETLIRAVVARDLAAIKCENDGINSKLDPDEAFTIGLFCQIGRLALAAAVPHEYEQLLMQTGPDQQQLLLEREKEAFGLNHNELAADMMADWHLPPSYCLAVRCQKSPDHVRRLQPDSTEEIILDLLDQQDWYLHMLKFTGTMSAILMQPQIRLSKAVLDHAVGQAGHLGLAPSRFAREYDSITNEWEEISAILEIKSTETLSWNQMYRQACI
ncbi:MAG: HDOD domain protein [Planctomycetes bacterium ADurb.Bin412]|nr:MAG: HDOD domain protein [Planctomycetes bacterium ADurb.Bin412]